jgi:CBS domain-containing protein
MKSKMPAATDVSKRVVLGAHTAEDLMTPNPVSISEHALVREAAAVLTDREIGAVTVISEAGRPVGVLSCYWPKDANCSRLAPTTRR